MPFLAVDIGNTHLKLGLYADGPAVMPRGKGKAAVLPEPERTLSVAVDRLDDIAAWLVPHEVAKLAWWIGSVQRSFTTELVDWLRRRGTNAITLLCARDLPLRVELPRPDMVGIDRLLAAVGANVLREPQRAAIIVDLGTAVTVDAVSVDGAFRGGAILPGIAMSARALHEFTDLLPLIDMAELHEAPPPVGQDTVAAMRSGLFWGTVGAARELIARMSGLDVHHFASRHGAPASSDGPAAPQVFLTGGAAASVAPLLAPDAIYAPHLTLGGIALTVGSAQRA